MIRCLQFAEGKQIRLEVSQDRYTAGDARRWTLTLHKPGTPEMHDQTLSAVLRRDEAAQLASWLVE